LNILFDSDIAAERRTEAEYVIKEKKDGKKRRRTEKKKDVLADVESSR
jgi:hypothetical protein